MKKFKGFGDLTPEEQRHHQLRHFPTMLNRWRGGLAQLWTYTVSHSGLTVRITRAGVRGNLQIGCSAVSYIRAPTFWQNCNLEIGIMDDGTSSPEFIVRDLGADVEIICGCAGVHENMKPIY